MNESPSRELLLEMVECLSSTISDCSSSIAEVERKWEEREKELKADFSLKYEQQEKRMRALEYRLAQQDQVIDNLSGELARGLRTTKEGMEEFIENALIHNNKRIVESNQKDKLQLVELCQANFIKEIEKLTKIVAGLRGNTPRPSEVFVKQDLCCDAETSSPHEWLHTSKRPSKDALTERCEKIVETSREAQQRLKNIPKRVSFNL